MNSETITEIFIRAAEVDRKLPDTARPAPLKAMNLGFVHTFADMNGWSEEEKHAANWAWLDPKNLRTTTNDVGIWEVAMEMMKLAPKPAQRRSLWAWARSEAKSLCAEPSRKRISFRRWCLDIEGILPATGNWRRNAAISSIELAFERKLLLHNGLASEPDFTNHPEIEDKKDSIEVWRPAEATTMACDFDTALDGFDWARKQNEARREREKRRRSAA